MQWELALAVRGHLELVLAAQVQWVLVSVELAHLELVWAARVHQVHL